MRKIDTTSVVDDRVKDTTKILVSELPIKFESTTRSRLVKSFEFEIIYS